MVKKLMVFLVLVGVFIIGCNTIETNEEIIKTNEDIRYIKDIYTCQVDNDCISVDADCCGCGGDGTATSINKNYLEYWSNKLNKDCENIECVAKESEDWTCFSKPKCINNKCKLVKSQIEEPSEEKSKEENCIFVKNKNIFYSALEEMKFDRTGNPLFVVVGDDQNMEDIKSSFNIANYLMNTLGVESTVKLAKEITDLDFFNGNIISVGSPCVNSISAKMIGNQTECIEGFNEGEGKIIFFRNNNYIQLMVAGYSSRDTLTTANAFTSFPLNYSIDKVFSANPEFVLNTSSNFMSFRGCVNYNSSENVTFESLYENFDTIPLIRECPKRKSINCMPSVPPFDRRFCHAKNSEWLKNNCNVSFSH